MNEFSKLSRENKTIAVIGFVLLIVGVVGLMRLLFGVSWLSQGILSVGEMLGKVTPIVMIVAGVYVLWAQKNGTLDKIAARTAGKDFGRSTADKRFSGVCGGIAAYFDIDSAWVRIVTVVLFVMNPPLVGTVYLVMSFALPRA